MKRKALESWQFPTTAVRLFFILLRTILGLNTVSMLITFNKKRNSDLNSNQKNNNFLLLLRLSYYCLLIVILTYLKLWIILGLYWFVPYLTWLQLISRIRSIAEHYALAYDHPLRQTRSTSTNLCEKLFFAPLNLNYHLEHHLYPSVPFYNLAKLHENLLQSEVFRQEAHLSNGYLGVLTVFRKKSPDLSVG
jgi:fatty acid desaturase